MEGINEAAMNEFLAKTRKAATAGLSALLASFGTAFMDGSITQAEIFAAIGLGIAAFGAVYRVPNKTEKR